MLHAKIEAAVNDLNDNFALKQGKHSARKPPKLIILQMCNKITEPNSFRDIQPLNYGSICPEVVTSKLRNRDPTFYEKGTLGSQNRDPKQQFMKSNAKA